MLLSYNFHTMLSLLYVITSPNLKLIAHFHTELWSFKVVNLDVCGSLVLSNPVTLLILSLRLCKIKLLKLVVTRVLLYDIPKLQHAQFSYFCCGYVI